jgi:hypothetical protein
MIIYFRRDWIRIIGGFLSSLHDRRIRTADQRLAWMIVAAEKSAARKSGKNPGYMPRRPVLLIVTARRPQ